MAQVQRQEQAATYDVKVRQWGFAHFLFEDQRAAPIWLVIRVWLGLQWLGSGWGKARLWDFANGTWLTNNGSSLKGYWERAIAVPPGGKGAVVTYDWYYEFLRFLTDGGHYTWFAWLVVLGEIAIGLGLITGTFTGIAAFFGALMNVSFVLAGTTSTNPILLLTAIVLIMAWRTAGYWGLDFYVLRWLGTPWQPGKVFGRQNRPTTPNLTGGARQA
jgi:thiosulfate dehydrogenase (quinone) large subunit